MKTLWIVIAMLIMINESAFAESEGGSDTGGGNVCIAANGDATILELLDSTKPRQRGDQLKTTKMMTEAGLDVAIDIPKTHSYRLALKKLENLAKSSPRTGSILLTSFGNLAPMETPFVPEAGIAGDMLGVRCDGKIVAAAIYKVAGILIISVPLFNALDLQSQVALFIHEALRQVQISARGNGSERELQDLTRQIMLDERVNLDASSFFSGVQLDEDGNVRVDASRLRLTNLATMDVAWWVRYPMWMRQGVQLSKLALYNCRAHIERLVRYPTLTDEEAFRLPNYGLTSKPK